MTRAWLQSIEDEYRRYQALAEGAMAQLTDEEWQRPAPGGGNSVAVLVRHLGGNLRSRFTEFLTADGEKPWRRRDEEFAVQGLARAELMAIWARGWRALHEALAELQDRDAQRIVRIRGVELSVHAALHRSLAHAAYHVGQIVLLARAARGAAWQWLSVPPGGSEAYARNPTMEHAADHAARLEQPPRA